MAAVSILLTAIMVMANVFLCNNQGCLGAHINSVERETTPPSLPVDDVVVVAHAENNKENHTGDYSNTATIADAGGDDEELMSGGPIIVSTAAAAVDDDVDDDVDVDDADDSVATTSKMETPGNAVGLGEEAMEKKKKKSNTSDDLQNEHDEGVMKDAVAVVVVDDNDREEDDDDDGDDGGDESRNHGNNYIVSKVVENPDDDDDDDDAVVVAVIEPESKNNKSKIVSGVGVDEDKNNGDDNDDDDDDGMDDSRNDDDGDNGGIVLVDDGDREIEGPNTEKFLDEFNKDPNSNPQYKVFDNFYDEFYGIGSGEKRKKKEVEKEHGEDDQVRSAVGHGDKSHDNHNNMIIHDYRFYDEFYGLDKENKDGEPLLQRKARRHIIGKGTGGKKESDDDEIDGLWGETVDRMIGELSDFLDNNNPCVLLRNRAAMAVGEDAHGISNDTIGAEDQNGGGGSGGSSSSDGSSDGSSSGSVGEKVQNCGGENNSSDDDDDDDSSGDRDALRKQTLKEMKFKINDVFKIYEESCQQSDRPGGCSRPNNAAATAATATATSSTTTVAASSSPSHSPPQQQNTVLLHTPNKTKKNNNNNINKNSTKCNNNISSTHPCSPVTEHEDTIIIIKNNNNNDDDDDNDNKNNESNHLHNHHHHHQQQQQQHQPPPPHPSQQHGKKTSDYDSHETSDCRKCCERASADDDDDTISNSNNNDNNHKNNNDGNDNNNHQPHTQQRQHHHHHPSSYQDETDQGGFASCYRSQATQSSCIDVFSQESVISQLCTKMTSLDSGNRCMTSRLSANQKEVDDTLSRLQNEIADLKSTVEILQRSAMFYAEAPFGSSQVRGYQVKVTQGRGFEPVSGFFTAPYDGAYQITVGYFRRRMSNTDDQINVLLDRNVIFRLHVDGSDEQRMFMTSLVSGQTVSLKTNVDYHDNNQTGSDGRLDDLVQFGAVLVK